jgi:hypothetical protein
MFRSALLTGCFTVLLPLVLAGTAAAEPTNLLKNGNFKEGKTAWNIFCYSKQALVAEVVAGPEQGSSALQVTVAEEPDLKKYMIGASQIIPSAIAATDTVKLRFMARSPQSVTIGAVLHTVQSPHRNKMYKNFILTPEWKTYEAIDTKPEAFVAGEAMIEFFMSFSPGQIEITNVEIAIN